MPTEFGDIGTLTLAALFAVALAAGFIDSIAGGGGLLTLPALLWAGLGPAQSLATNKVQAVFGSLSASVHFIRIGAVRPKDMAPAILGTAVGAGAGALVVQRLNPAVLNAVVPFLLIAVALFLLVSRGLGADLRPARITPALYALAVAPLLGFYDGFFGPGTGTFMALSLVLLMGHDLGMATARTKILNLTGNAFALGLFLFGHQILWGVGLTMAVGQVIGATLGSKLVSRQGAKVVRPALVLISVALSLKLLFVGDSAPLHGMMP